MGSLRFDSLKLVGFKSFVEPTMFQIEPGLTGVVGPNGCGKSNLLEAIRWVMGANSAKAMRASGMDDVIFSGTKTRPGRNQASVTLNIHNGARCAPSMFNDNEDLEVTRIITKGSGSKYKVNGKTVRAKDVQLLFADASTGANSPALVRQGQINELISAKPANRRRILEEAAGISGLHPRRHEAELRLRAAENNLDRLEDILAQIESQLLSLRRQSRQAARYKRLAGEIREYKALLWLKRWQLALSTLAETEEAQKRCETDVQELTGLVANLTTKVSEIAVQLEPHREEQIVSAAICGRLNAAKDALDNDEQAAKTEIEKLKSRLEFLASDIEREESIVADAKNAHDKLAEELEALTATNDNSAAVEAAKVKSESAKSTRSDLETDYHRLSQKMAQHAATKRGYERERDDLDRRLNRILQDVELVNGQIADLEKAEQSAGADNLFAASAQQAIDALQNARTREQKANEDKHHIEDEVRSLRDVLAEAQSALSEALARKNAIAAIVHGAQNDGQWTPVVDEITVEKGFETALAAALGDELDAGRQAGLPHSWHGTTPPDQSLPGDISNLSEYVNAPTELSARLSQIGIADKETAQTLAASLKPGQRLVTQEGDLWRWDGYHKRADAPSAAAIKLQNINTLEMIEADLPALERAKQIAHENWAAKERALNEAHALAKQAREALRGCEREEREAQLSLSQFETEKARKAEQRAALAERLERLEKEHAELKTRLGSAHQALEDLENIEGLQNEIETISAALEKARDEADEAAAEYRSLASEFEARVARKRAIEQDIKDWERRKSQATDRITGLHGRLAETQQALEAALETP
ncbi:MAG TPA: chromosome segregation protein SMC, partial [Hellea balneolensis]|nr:chromosome segregation protein SMC [Hellea balneolensis]